MKILQIYKELDRPQKLAIFLILALIIHSVFVFSHPAYRFYTKYTKKFEHDYAIFTNHLDKIYITRLNEIEKKFNDETLPFIDNLVSNTIFYVNQSSQFLSKNKLTSSPFESNQKTGEIILQKPIDIVGNYFIVNGDKYIYIEGQKYSIGDYFRASPILYIEPLYFETQAEKYHLIQRSKNNEQY